MLAYPMFNVVSGSYLTPVEHPSEELPSPVRANLIYGISQGLVQAVNPVSINQYEKQLVPIGPEISVKYVNKPFGKVNLGKFGLKGDMNTDAIEQLIHDGKRFFLTSGGQQLLNNILSGVS